MSKKYFLIINKYINQLKIEIDQKIINLKLSLYLLYIQDYGEIDLHFFRTRSIIMSRTTIKAWRRRMENT